MKNLYKIKISAHGKEPIFTEMYSYKAPQKEALQMAIERGYTKEVAIKISKQI